MDQPSKVANLARGSAEQRKLTFPYSRSRLRIWSRETGSAVPSRVDLLPQAESGAHSAILPGEGTLAIARALRYTPHDSQRETTALSQEPWEDPGTPQETSPHWHRQFQTRPDRTILFPRHCDTSNREQ
ncbi:unnamed protein product [Ascophyllum nodosum]